MSANTQADFFRLVEERHAVKHFDPSYKLNEREIMEMIAAAAKAPSAWNLQHWKFLAIMEQSAKEKLLPIAYGQMQIVEASAVVAVLGDLEANRNAEPVYRSAVEAGFMTEEIKSNLMKQIDDAYSKRPAFPRDDAIRNASLAAMQLMLAAKAKRLDSCPMGGFDSEAFIAAFAVPSRFIPVLLVAIGKGAVHAHPSSRFPVEQTIAWNGFA
ncbi:nitroreductase family protein [Cohnella zeiphila]|uniref:Nitroreductase family protein n=1 Tax=Cohnella zeiphila TaxID=2761120 RepID=A0A7X0SL98_9BACL|nr:nitroreductase family protein [Cohnella zeiphila]MBB6732088.1 nitroreductase family protein [Cohnella zeiphila]